MNTRPLNALRRAARVPQRRVNVPHIAAHARVGRLAAVCLLGFAAAAAHGQHFGRNKVLWEELDFAILETEHFEIHYYPENDPSAEYVARLAERWYERLSGFFEHEFGEKKPIVIYQDHADFQQTTTTAGLISEGTGGFTESVQNRVVLPLTGINADNDHVIGHELVHAFQFDMAQQVRDEPGSGQRAAQPRQLPLWMVEGLAEYLSQGREDPHTAMTVRDAVQHEELPDPGAFIQRQPSPYQYGQAVWAYIGGHWGDDHVRRLYGAATRVGPRAAFMDVLGLEQQAFFEQFHDELRATYAPLLDGRQSPGAFAEPVLTRASTDSNINISPSLSPDGRWIAFLSTRELAMELYLADARTGEIVRKLVSAQTDPHYQNLSFLDSSVAWSPDGRRFAFGVFAEGERRLALYDLERGRVERRLDLEGIKGMRHPTFSPDGRSLVFSAVEHGASDLYRLDLGSGDLERLTDDRYTAIQPEYAPSGGRIVFVTDRGPHTSLELLDFGGLGLAMLDLRTREIETLPLFDRGKHVDPHFSPDGRSLYFVADAEGVADVYRYTFASSRIERLTSLKTGASGITDKSPAISVARETGAMALTVLDDRGFGVYRFTPAQGTAVTSPTTAAAIGRLPPEPGDDAMRVVSTYLVRPELGLPSSARTFATRDYESRIGLAHVGPATIGVGRSEQGSFGGGSFAAYFSDTLSRHQILTTFQGGSAGGVLDFSDTLGAEVTYLNQAHRLQWGASVSRLPYLTSQAAITRGTVPIDGEQVPADIVNRLYRIVTDQRASLIGRYPLSINHRFEFGVGVHRIGFDAELEQTVFPVGAPPFREQTSLPSPETLDLRTATAAFVRDTSQYGFVSPLRGMRFRAETEWTRGDLEYRTNLLDIRKYWLNRPVTVALRAVHLGRRGPGAGDSRLAPLDIARGTLVRGYSFDDFDVSECTVTEAPAGTSSCPELDRLIGSRIAAVNFEIRLPLLGNEEFGFFNVPAAPTELFFFTDIGAAWTADQPVDWTYDTDTTARVPVVSTGIGIRSVVFGRLPIELFYANPHHRPDAGSQFGFRIRTGW